MKEITAAVLKYRDTKSEDDFRPIWKHFEPKIKSIARQKSLYLSIDYCMLYERIVDGLLLAINNFDQTKSNFLTYFYQRVNGKISVLMRDLNRQKRRIQFQTESLNIISDSEQDLELQIVDKKATATIDDDHSLLATMTIDTILGEC